MKIRQKLTLQFSALAGLILLLTLISIYISFSNYRQEEFYDRLEQKARAVAQMLIDIDEVDAQLLQKIEENNPTSLPSEKISIYDFQNMKLYSSDRQQTIRIDENLLDKVRLEGRVQLKQEPYEVLGLFYTGKFDRFVVIAAAADIYGLQKLKNLRIILLIGFLASLVAVFLAGLYFAGRSLKPMGQVVKQVDQIGENNLNLRVSEGNGQDEIASLARTFNRMLDRLENAFSVQKSFIANASHELRNPLTAITGQLEVTLLKERKPEAYQQTLISVLEDIRNLNRISNRLLLLAQASSIVSPDDFTEIRIDELIWQCISEIVKVNSGYQVIFIPHEQLDDENYFKVRGSESLLKTCLNNLMENGCKYSDNRQVKVLIQLDENNRRQLLIHFENSGQGIPEEELGRIWQPFYRASNARAETGHGLGLSLVEKIVKMHQGAIQVHSQPWLRTTFTLRLPLVY